MKQVVNPHELACIRLFQQGRATYSDGYELIRMFIGTFATAVLFLLAVLNGVEYWLCFMIAIGGVVATATWDVMAGQAAGKRRVAELLNSRKGKP